ncbi:hypothetical protein SALWKB12_2071 [Snodgrassella communis]|nr:hypothetical protein SALWKB12_2071 [Snodgrassella communis]
MILSFHNNAFCCNAFTLEPVAVRLLVVDADSSFSLLLVSFRPVDKLARFLSLISISDEDKLLKPVTTLLDTELMLAESLLTSLFVLNNWPPVTTSLESESNTPSFTLVMRWNIPLWLASYAPPFISLFHNRAFCCNEPTLVLVSLKEVDVDEVSSFSFSLVFFNSSFKPVRLLSLISCNEVDNVSKVVLTLPDKPLSLLLVVNNWPPVTTSLDPAVALPSCTLVMR